MTYEEARSYAANVSKSGSVLGLFSIEHLMQELGDVQEKLKIIHIAGTNGKGSTGAYLESVLIEAGYKVGRYTSPAVFEPLEVWRINRENISPLDYADMMGQVKCACDRMVEKGMEQPTIFEVETALAFLYFYRKNCDYVLLEVGMGGSTDATNLISKPLCSVITSVSMDHMQFLGNTLEDIAKAKAGIIKEGCPVVTIEQKEPAMRVIKEKAEKMHAKLFVSDTSKVSEEKASLKEICFCYEGLGQVVSPLTGTYQIENCCLAITVLKEVLNIPDTIILTGVEKTEWAGRFEVIGENPLFIIDGAHNEDAAVKLRKTVENYFTNLPITYIIGVLADKEHEKVLKELLPYAGAVFTVTPENGRAMQADKLAAEAIQVLDMLEQQKEKPEDKAGNVVPKEKKRPEVTACSSIEEAVELALKETQKDGVILAFGSLSYLKEVKKLMQAK